MLQTGSAYMCKAYVLTAIPHSDFVPSYFYCHRIQKELADITLDPPPNCRLVLIPYLKRVGKEGDAEMYPCVVTVLRGSGQS